MKGVPVRTPSMASAAQAGVQDRVASDLHVEIERGSVHSLA